MTEHDFLEEAKQSQFTLKDLADSLNKATDRADVLHIASLLHDQAQDLEELVQKYDEELEEDTDDLDLDEDEDFDDEDDRDIDEVDTDIPLSMPSEVIKHTQLEY